MKTIIKYKYFETSKQFEEWQEKNDIVINQINPFIQGYIEESFRYSAKSNSDYDKMEKAENYTKNSVFVLYYEGKDETDTKKNNA